MAHRLSIRKTGTAEMAYVGQPPWHGLGQHVEGEAMTSAQALKAAGLDWTVEKQRLHLPDGRVLDEHFASVRTDTGAPLGVVGRVWQPLQNAEAFAWFDALAEEGAAIYHTAGAIDGGARVWILAKLPEDLVIVPGDVVKQYILLCTGHDGMHMTEACWTPTRVVCWNTLTVALQGAAQSMKLVRIVHSGKTKSHLDEAAKVLGVARRYYKLLGERFQALTAHQLTAMASQEYFTAVFPQPEAHESKVTHQNWDGLQARLAGLFSAGRNNILPGMRGSTWAAFNAVTELVDHHATYKNADTRFDSVIYGRGRAIKQRAFVRACAVAGIGGATDEADDAVPTIGEEG